MSNTHASVTAEHSAVKHLVSIACAVAGLVTALPAAAQFRKPEDAVKYRQAAFTVLGNQFNRIAAMAKGTVPFDGAAAAASAELVAQLARLPFEGFVEGTAGKGEKGSARPEIWTQRAKFDDAAKKLQVESTKLLTAARSNNLESLKTAFGATADSCKTCHEDFRAK